VPAIVVEDYDRAAPNGVGQVGGMEWDFFFGGVIDLSPFVAC
jgi:hypothetical protein